MAARKAKERAVTRISGDMLKAIIKDAVREVIVEMAEERMDSIKREAQADQGLCNAIDYGREFPRA